MASLMENLIRIMGQEGELYEKLLDVSRTKTPAIVAGNLAELARVTEEEQRVVDEIAKVDREREQNMRDIADVLNKDKNTLTITQIIGLLDKRPSEANALAKASDRVRAAADRLRLVNEQNQKLLQGALDMVGFEMNIVNARKMAPESANYTKNAWAAGDTIGYNRSGFDAKQ